MRFDRRCDCGTGVCGGGVGWNEAGGEHFWRGNSLEGLVGEGEGEEAGGVVSEGLEFERGALNAPYG